MQRKEERVRHPPIYKNKSVILSPVNNKLISFKACSSIGKLVKESMTLFFFLLAPLKYFFGIVHFICTSTYALSILHIYVYQYNLINFYLFTLCVLKNVLGRIHFFMKNPITIIRE